MIQLDEQPPDDSAYEDALLEIIWRPGYTIDIREAAFARLEQRDPEELKRTIRQRLPQMNAWQWNERLCEIIADRGWIELSPALVSSWARPLPGVEDSDRPEYKALVQLQGEDRVIDVILAEMIESNAAWQQGFRTRCWNLLYRLGQRERLVALLSSADIPPDDGMLLDLQAAALEMGIVPHNREEILWIREIRRPERAEFWSQAVVAVSTLSPAQKLDLELRDLPILVSATIHDPALLERTEAQLYGNLEQQLKGERHFGTADSGNRAPPRLQQAADRLTWSDLLAMTIALQALSVPEVRAHLFDYAERDRADTSTEYGGIIDLDGQGRFEVLEFPPRIRHHDQKFIASQEMFDAGYTALFHFHFHVQRPDNRDYAGPGLGDETYATNVRANCLVLTSVGEDRLNVDFYRHGGLVVDLGVVERDPQPSR